MKRWVFAILAVLTLSLIIVFTTGTAHLLAGENPPAATPKSAPASESVPKNSGVRLSSPSWTQPQPGWLYIVDTNNMGDQSQILLLDPQAGVVRGSLRTGHAPEIALSPDGTRLYVVASQDGPSLLSIIDTATGQVLNTTEIQYRESYIGESTWPGLAISPDGHWLYINQLHILAPGQDEYSVIVFDTRTGNILPEHIQIPGCPLANLVPEEQGGHVLAFCRATNDVRSLTFTVSNTTRQQSPAVTYPLSPVFGSLVGAQLLSNGEVMVVDSNAQIALSQSRLDQLRIATTLKLSDNQQILPSAVTMSPDGDRLYLGIRSTSDPNGQAHQIMVIDSTSWKAVQTLELDHPFTHLATSHSGSEVYATDPDGGLLMIVDTTNGKEANAISGVGIYPTSMVVVP